MKLNIGCGGTRKEGYIGVDIKPGPNVDVERPAHNLPYLDGEVDEIYTSHMLEHVAHIDWTLKEFARVLRTGGLLSIRVPNFEIYVREWLEGTEDYREEWGLINIFGWQGRGPGMFTRTGWTCARFNRMLPKFGFHRIVCLPSMTRMTSGPEFRPNGDLICECYRA